MGLWLAFGVSGFFFLQWKFLHWMLNCYRSEMILASGKHTPAPPRLYLLSKFFKIRQEDCNRILKLKCNPRRIWSAASLWSRRAFRCVGVTGFGDQTLPRSQNNAWCGHKMVWLKGERWEGRPVETLPHRKIYLTAIHCLKISFFLQWKFLHWMLPPERQEPN